MAKRNNDPDPGALLTGETIGDSIGASGGASASRWDSCIKHHGARSIPLRADYVWVCKGDHVCALLLAQMEYKTNCLIEAAARNADRNAAARRAGREAALPTDLWFRFPQAHMVQELLHAANEKTIRAKVDKLETELGLIESRVDPFDPRMKEYRLLLRHLQAGCDRWVAAAGNSGKITGIALDSGNFTPNLSTNPGSPSEDSGKITGISAPADGIPVILPEDTGKNDPYIPVNLPAYTGNFAGIQGRARDSEYKQNSTDNNISISRSSTEAGEAQPGGPPALMMMNPDQVSSESPAPPPVDSSPVPQADPTPMDPAASDVARKLIGELTAWGVSPSAANWLLANRPIDAVRAQLDEHSRRIHRERLEGKEVDSGRMLFAACRDNWTTGPGNDEVLKAVRVHGKPLSEEDKAARSAREKIRLQEKKRALELIDKGKAAFDSLNEEAQREIERAVMAAKPSLARLIEGNGPGADGALCALQREMYRRAAALADEDGTDRQ